MKTANVVAALIASPLMMICAQPALAAPKAQPGDPVAIGDGFLIDPIIDGRLRYEHVEAGALDADAVTMRMRAGAELKHSSGLSFLAEAEATLAINSNYNAFPYVIADSQRRPQFATVADPENVELNRLQLQYKSKLATVTVGRQRINLDDQRWVGSVGWRQNEQTFDAVRGEAKLGPVSLDATYSISQRTIFGIEAGPRLAYDGDFIFLGAGAKLGPVNVKAFAYLLDYDTAEQLGALATANADTQTYGARATASFNLPAKAKLNLAASYARQSDYKTNPVNYSADYIAGEAAVAYGGLTLTGGYEKMGSDNGRAVQTPMATLHKFDGWADVFLTTPTAGLVDIYGGASYKFSKLKALPGLNAGVTFHRFESDVGNLHYGDEWDASAGFKISRFNLLAKYASYNAKGFGSDTKKFWLQLEFAY